MTNETNEERNETFVLRKLDGIAQQTVAVSEAGVFVRIHVLAAFRYAGRASLGEKSAKMSYSPSLCLRACCEREYWNLYRNPPSLRRQPHKTWAHRRLISSRPLCPFTRYYYSRFVRCPKPARCVDVAFVGHELAVTVYVSVFTTEIPVNRTTRT